MTLPKEDLLMWSISQCAGEEGRGGGGKRGEAGGEGDYYGH